MVENRVVFKVKRDLFPSLSHEEKLVSQTLWNHERDRQSVAECRIKSTTEF
jgi:hypothetical protein